MISVIIILLFSEEAHSECFSHVSSTVTNNVVQFSFNFLFITYCLKLVTDSFSYVWAFEALTGQESGLELCPLCLLVYPVHSDTKESLHHSVTLNVHSDWNTVSVAQLSTVFNFKRLSSVLCLWCQCSATHWAVLPLKYCQKVPKTLVFHNRRASCNQ